MRETREPETPPPHDADSMAARRSVETDRHMMVKVDIECTTSSHSIMGSRPASAGSQ